jgi:hypothetical protein
MIDFTMRTPKWRSLLCENNQLAIMVNKASRPNYKAVHILATNFIFEKLGFGDNSMHMKRFSRAVGEKVLKYSHEYGCLDETRVELQWILATLDLAIGSRIANLHSSILEQQQAKQLHNDEPLETVENTGEDTAVALQKKWDHACRKDTKNLINNGAKLQKIIEVHNAATKEQVTALKMTEPCRAFFRDSAGPIVCCLTLHRNGNVYNFLEHHTRSGKIVFSKFFKICLLEKRELHVVGTYQRQQRPGTPHGAVYSAISVTYAPATSKKTENRTSFSLTAPPAH